MLALPCAALQAQTAHDLELLNACKEEVHAINSLTLYKKLNTISESQINLTLVNYMDVVEGIMIYYDSNKKIRKFIQMYDYPESNGFKIHYFDADGYAVHSVVCGSIDITGNSFMNKNKLVYLNIEIRDENYQIEETIEQYGDEGSFSAIGFSHTDSIPKHLTDDPLLRYDAKTAKRVTFSSPKANDKTVTNVRRANLRAKPSTNAEIITVVEMNGIVQILESVNDQWYKVEVNGLTGYLFGELLEPVEQEKK
jgi:hypothetical protein